MNCREFQHFWRTRPDTELSPDARLHLDTCPTCAAEAFADAATDAALRRLAAAQPAPDVDLARARLREALSAAAPSAPRFTPTLRAGTRRRPMALAAVGLSATAVLTALVMRPQARQEAQKAIRTVILPRAVGPSGVAPREASPPSPPIMEGVGKGLSLSSPIIEGPGGLPPIRQQPPFGEQKHHPDRAGTRDKLQPPSPFRRGGQGGEVNPPSERQAPLPTRDPDLLSLNEGRFADAQPFAPRAATPPLPAPLPTQELQPGSRVVDDLLLLNPIRVAGADESALGAAATALDAGPATDPRLLQKVTVHATNERLADLLGLLSRATGVTLVAQLEVAEEGMSLWATDRPLIDVMRDVRHQRGYYWSRARRSGQYVYSIWQDAQSRAREEAELKRFAIEQQRLFEEGIRKHLKALDADEAELKRLAREDPYLVAQMKHPVVRGGYRLLATLSPDERAQLFQGRTPSRGYAVGEVLFMLRGDSRPGDRFFDPIDTVASYAPRGDVVTLRAAEMSAAQRATLTAILKGAATFLEREAETRPNGWQAATQVKADAAAAAEIGAATVSLFRWGDASGQGVSMHVDFQSNGRRFVLYSNLAMPPDSQRFYGDMIRKGEFRLWPGAQAELDRYLGRDGRQSAASTGPAVSPADHAPADPILDSPVSFTWELPLRDGQRLLSGPEVLAALHRDLRYPLVCDGAPEGVSRRDATARLYRVEKRPLRELLREQFPGWQIQTARGALFIRHPERLRWRLNAVPPAVVRFLKEQREPFTLEDMALLARSLSPWQVVKLRPYLPPRAVDQLLAAQELLRLYGELAPAQRRTLAGGLPFSAMTPTQRALFLAFAQRQRPFVEPWRFQSGSLRLTSAAPPKNRDGLGGPFLALARRVLTVRFHENDTASFPVDLFPPQPWTWDRPPRDYVGRPFPFGVSRVGDLGWKPALTDRRLRKQAMVMIFSAPFVEPYAGTGPSPGIADRARALAERLRDTGLAVVHVTVGAMETATPPPADPRLPHLISLSEPGDGNVQPLCFGDEHLMPASPTLYVIDHDEIIRAAFEGPDVADLDAVERAARRLLPADGSRAAAAPGQ